MRRLLGALLIILGLIFNEWILEVLLLGRTTFAAETRWMIRLTQLTLLGAGVVVWRKPPWARFRDLTAVVFNLLLLFVLSNLIAHLALLARQDDEYSPAHWFHRPRDLLHEDPGRLRAAYPGRSDAEIAALIEPPNIVGHPVLPFMERPIRSTHYNVGLENIRGVVSSTAALQGAVWVFGGSTVFGHGVADDETIVAALQKKDATRRYLNFGVQGYDSSLELQKLLLLLEKGYRPQAVWVMDGLNDMLACLASDFDATETPMPQFVAYAHHFHVGTFVRQRGLVALLRPLPLTQLLLDLRADAPPYAVADVDDPDDPYHRDPLMHYRRTPAAYEGKLGDLDRYADKLIVRMAGKHDVMRKLGQAYGFEVRVFFQPIGLLALANPFIRAPQEAYREGEVYRILAHLTRRTQAAIVSGRLQMIDLSASDAECGGCYVDLAHYNPQLCEIVAQRMMP